MKIFFKPNTDIMQSNPNGYWSEKKEKLKQQYPVITDEDLIFTHGKEKVMIEKLGYKLGKTIDELRYMIAIL